MCSKKCAKPGISFISLKLPTPIHNPVAAFKSTAACNYLLVLKKYIFTIFCSLSGTFLGLQSASSSSSGFSLSSVEDTSSSSDVKDSSSLSDSSSISFKQTLVVSDTKQAIRPLGNRITL